MSKLDVKFYLGMKS